MLQNQNKAETGNILITQAGCSAQIYMPGRMILIQSSQKLYFLRNPFHWGLDVLILKPMASFTAGLGL